MYACDNNACFRHTHKIHFGSMNECIEDDKNKEETDVMNCYLEYYFK